MIADLRALVDALAREGAGEYGERVEETAPGLVAALRAVLDVVDEMDQNDLYAAYAFRLRRTITTALEAP